MVLYAYTWEYHHYYAQLTPISKWSTYPNRVLWIIFEYWTKMKKVNAIKLCYLLIWCLLDICSTIEESCCTSVTMVLRNLLTNFDFESVIFRIFVAAILLCAFIYFLVCLQLHGENDIITRSSKQNKDKCVLKKQQWSSCPNAQLTPVSPNNANSTVNCKNFIRWYIY